jgi:type IV pilus assembly protein PilA
MLAVGRRRGFTLVELMIAVAIIGVMSATAIPAYMNYIRRSKTSEAAMNVRKLFDSALTYFLSEHADANGVIVNKMFPTDRTWTPTSNACCNAPNVAGKCSPSPTYWVHPVWTALNFSVDDPHYYVYSAIRNPNAVTQQPGHQYVLGAQGNLDCDNFQSLFQRHATITTQWDVRGSSGLYIANEIE